MADAGRPNQRRRTRKDLLHAASELMRAGETPTLEDVAAKAMVSRATAYRYFPNVEALLLEAPLDVAMPDAAAVFADAPAADPVARMDHVDAAFDEMMAANETQLRMMLAHAVQRPLRAGDEEAMPTRQNRRSPLIEAALAPAESAFKPADLDALAKALALVVGPEAMIVFKDVLQVDDDEARKVRRWAIRALVNAARRARRGRAGDER